MKKLDSKSKEYAVIFGITIAVSGIVLYPLFDIVLCKFITNSEFIYSAHEHIIQPVLFGMIMGIMIYVLEHVLKSK